MKQAIPREHLERFERTGRIDWVSDLAEITRSHGVCRFERKTGGLSEEPRDAHPLLTR